MVKIGKNKYVDFDIDSICDSNECMQDINQ